MLVVEDEVAVGRALERLLRKWGAQVHLISDPMNADALEALLIERQPTTVVSDLLLNAGLDGVGVLALARKVVPAATRVLLSGSLFMLDDSMRGTIEPCVYVPKPWDSSELRVRLGLHAGGDA